MDYTTAEAAKLLGISRRAIQQAVLSGRLKARRFGARGWVVSGSAIERALSEGPSRQAVQARRKQ